MMDKKIIVYKNKQDEVIGIEYDNVMYEKEEGKDLGEFIASIPEISGKFKTENLIIKTERKSPKSKKTASKNLRQRITAVGLVVAIAAAGLVGCGIKKSNAEKKEVPQETITYEIDEEDPELKAHYEKILSKYKDGEELIDTLEIIDETHEKINTVAKENPDKKGKVAIIYAEELAAIHDVYNSNTDEKTLLEDEDAIRCNYFQGQAALINNSQGSRDVQEIDDLFTDEDMKEKQQEIQKATQTTISNNNKATSKFTKMLKEIFSKRGSNPELQSEVAFGQAGLAAAITPQLSGKTLKNYQEASKTEGGQLGEVINDASQDSKRFAVEDNEINLEKQRDIEKALKLIDNKENLKDYDRTDFDPSTTEKGKELVEKQLKEYGITDDGSEQTTTQTTTKQERKKVTREEAVKKFGEDKVKEKEEKVEVDTNGDGKNDTPMDEANEESKEKGEQEAADRARGFEAGQAAFVNGGSSTTTKGSKAYQEGYAWGYREAKKVYDEQKKDDKKEETFIETKEKEEETKPEPKPEPEPDPEEDYNEDEEYIFDEEFVPANEMKTTRQLPKSIERDGVIIITEEIKEEPKTRVYGSQY